MKTHRATLPNGLELVLAELPGARVSSTQVFARVGSREDPPERSGLAHFVEHLLFRGCERFPSASELSQHLASFGARANGWTTFDRTALMLQTRPRHLASAVAALADMVCRPLLNGLEVERRVVMDERQRAADGESTEQRCVKQAWGARGHFRHSPLGTALSIASITEADVRAHLQRYFVGRNLALIVVGPHPLDELRTAARPFEALPPGLPHTCAQVPAPQRGAVHFENPSRRCDLRFSFPFLRRQGSDTVRVVVDELLGAGPQGRLFRALRFRRGIAYACRAALYGWAAFGLQVIDVEASLENTVACAQEVIATVKDLRDKGPEAAELAAAKECMLRVTDELCQDPAQHGGLLGARWLEEDRRGLEGELEAIANVTADDVRSLTATLFAPGVGHLAFSGSQAHHRALTTALASL
ncbi:MAG: insulinase family protein [Myxococcales bacterium]|nr:insulinase family protein [Myxococcales bacterium]